MMIDRAIDAITGYHAHIYYDDDKRDHSTSFGLASEVREALEQT